MAKKKKRASGHTPGPWKHNGLGFIHARNEYGDLDIVASIESEDPDSVYQRNEKEGEANANLIAAAPDLLAAARNLLEFLATTNMDPTHPAVQAMRSACDNASL